MTRDQAVTLLLGRLGSRATSLSATILLEMDEAQLRLEGDASLLPWFLITESASTFLIIGEERLGVPTDFIQEFEDASLQILNPDSTLWVNLLKDDYDNLVEEYLESEPSLPKKYALVGEYFRVRPVPDVAYSIRTLYFAHQVLPSLSNVENSWLKHAGDLLLAETGLTVANLHLQDFELAAKFEMQQKQARDRVWKLNESKQHANRSYQMGDD